MVDGKNNSHGVVIIAVSIGKSCNFRTRIPREKRKLTSETRAGKAIPIKQYLHYGIKPLASIKFRSIKDLSISSDIDKSRKVDLLWQMGYFFKKQQPHWSGFMQRHINSEHPGKATVNFLSIINLNPSDESCIYSTLLFVEQQAQQRTVPSPCITFDQSLFIKGFEISKAKDMNIVIRLGGFHLLMLFLGGTGTLMEGCGLAETMETMYAPNIAVHMLEGKTYARALRCHVIETSLQLILFNKIIADEKNSTDNSLVEIKELYSDMSESTVEHFDGDSLQSEYLQHVFFAIEEYKNFISNCSRTSKLWIQYLYHVSLVKDFTYAERTGDWNLHLVTVKRMLNLFAAAGRVNYAKSARLYLQSMDALPEQHPWLHQCFQ